MPIMFLVCELLILLIVLLMCVLFFPPIRPIYFFLRKRIKPVSIFEKQAVDAGNRGFESSFFTGRPDWNALKALPPLRFTQNEQNFLDGPTEELCKIIDDWSIRYVNRKIPKNIWDFAKNNGFLGLRVPKKYGGTSFSFQAQSAILGKVASRSLDVSTIVEVPNSLGPDELIEKYGTESQKKYYLPRFSQGKEVPSFAVTSPTGGSDAASMRDIGVVTYDYHEGIKKLGIRLTWDKRYITFAPEATLIVLSFHLFDNDNILKRGNDLGITLALIPASYPGVDIGKRHLPSGAAFPNGPIRGRDVFIPIEWIIGAQFGIGQGWKMIMECLFVGRALSLPSMSVATIKAMLRYSTAYARIRKQFGISIGTVEGIEEPIARLVEISYISESARAVTASMVDVSQRSVVVSSLMKYQTTEYVRRAINDAIDIHGGKAIFDGPSNYLLSAYQMAPIGVTVEGANIVTRSLITFSQGILSSHPYLYKEFEAITHNDEGIGLKEFAPLFKKHLLLFISNMCRAYFHTITKGALANAPKKAKGNVVEWYRKLTWESCRFAFLSDMTILFLGNQLKKKQKITGRLSDIISELFFLSCTLKRYEEDGLLDSDLPILKLCMQNGLYRLENAVSAVISNFPNKFARAILFAVLIPFGTNRKPASDNLTHIVSKSVLEPGGVRDRLTRYIFVSNNPDEPTGRLEVAFQRVFKAESIYKKIKDASREGKLARFHGIDWINNLQKVGILTKDECYEIIEIEALIEKVIAIDFFSKDTDLTHRGAIV